MDWFDTYSDPSVKAASVVTNLWIAAFAVCSACFALLGAVVALQWPNPRVFCYKTSYSDMPSNSLRSCCSLYSLNLGFTVFWLLVFAIMVIARDVVRIIVCLAFCLVHVAVVIVFRMKFKRYGRPERQYNPSTEMVMASSAAAGTTSLAPGQTLGIPVYNIPMQTVVIGSGRTGDGNAGGGGSGGQQGPYQPWGGYDADCVPPAQQHMVGMHPSAGAAAAGDAAGAGPYAPQPLPAGPYPPQPTGGAASPGAGAGGFVMGQPVTGLPAHVVLPPPPPPSAGGTGGGGAGGGAALAAAAGASQAAPGTGALPRGRTSTEVGAAAGAAAAAGAGAAGARSMQQ